MDHELELILIEIEEIIAKIGNYDIGNLKLSQKGRKELTLLFRNKLRKAQQIRNKFEIKLVG